MSQIVDTGFLYALLNAKESQHQNVLRVSQNVKGDLYIDFVDATLVAVAERLNIVRILTLDARHFRLFRPKHCVAFEILP